MKPTNIKCDKCWRDHFKSQKGLSIHKTRVHPYVPPPPPLTRHVPFESLIKRNSNWGVEMTRTEEQHPSIATLSLAAQMRTVSLLEEILTELKRSRTIN